MHVLLQRHARSLVDHIGEDGIAFVGIAHHLARRAEGMIAAGSDVGKQLLDGLHFVGRGPAHGKKPGALAAVLAVHGDGPFQRLHRRDAGGVHRQMADGHGLARLTGERKTRQIFHNRVMDTQLALAVQDAGAQRGHGFAHRSDAEHRIAVRRDAFLRIAEAVVPAVALSVRAEHICGNAGEVIPARPAVEVCVKSPCIDRRARRIENVHTVLLCIHKE